MALKKADELKILEAFSRVIDIMNIDLTVIRSEQEDAKYNGRTPVHTYKQISPSSHRKIVNYTKIILDIKKELRELQASIDVSELTDEELKNLIKETDNIVELGKKIK